MDFIIHGNLIKEKEIRKKNKKIIYYKEFNKDKKLDDLVRYYNENIIKKTMDMYPAWLHTFKVINHPEYDYNIDRTSLIKKIIPEIPDLSGALLFFVYNKIKSYINKITHI